MKKIPSLVFCIIFIASVSCKTKAKTNNSTENTSQTQPTVYKGVTNDSCAVEMAFGSYGAGIDGAALDAVVKKIEAKKLKYSAKNIGREGETRLCLPLTEIKGKEKKEFIDQLKKIAAEGQLVSVSIR
jgi:hypothetical protein